MAGKKVDFGVRVPVSGPLANVENIKASTVFAESLEYDTAWVHDQFVWSREQNSHHISSGAVEAVVPNQPPNFFESITTLSYMAGITKEIRLGVAIVVLPLRNPVVLAKQLMNLDTVSNGRLLLGVGAGAPLVGKTFEVVGVPFDKRGEITDDYLKAIIAIFDQESSTYDGKYAHFHSADIFPKAVQKPHPPIIVGGLGRAIRRAALLGEGWIPANISAENVTKGVNKIHSIAQSAGRGNIDFVIGNEIFVSIDKDSNSARNNALATISSYARSIGRGGEDVTLVGSVSEVIEKVERYIQSGVNLFELKFIYKNMDSFFSQLKLFSQEVIPSF